MNKLVASLTCFAIFAASNLVVEAKELGKAEINGKAVIIDSDGTWSFADQKPVVLADCKQEETLTSKSVPVSFCAVSPWVVSTNPVGSFEYTLTNSDLGCFAGLISEKSQISEELAEEAILVFAAKAMNKTVADVPVKKRTSINIGGKQWHYIEFAVTIKGAAFTFGNYYATLGNAGFVQFMVWSSDNLFEKSRPAFETLASGLRIQ